MSPGWFLLVPVALFTLLPQEDSWAVLFVSWLPSLVVQLAWISLLSFVFWSSHKLGPASSELWILESCMMLCSYVLVHLSSVEPFLVWATYGFLILFLGTQVIHVIYHGGIPGSIVKKTLMDQINFYGTYHIFRAMIMTLFPVFQVDRCYDILFRLFISFHFLRRVLDTE